MSHEADMADWRAPRPAPRPGLIARRYRTTAGAVGSACIALFVALVLWLLLAGPTSVGGAGGGKGGGHGGGAGGGIGRSDGAGAGASGDAHAAGAAPAGDVAGGEVAPESSDPTASAGAPDAESADLPRRPPLRVGFTAAPEQDASREVVDAEKATEGGSAAPAGAGAPGAGAGGGGGDGAPSFMGVRGRGTRVVYVIDRSGSMGSGQRLAHARYELKRSIRDLPEDGEFLVIFFDTAPLPMPGARLVRASRANVDRYSRWVDQQLAGGGTDPTEAMAQALALGPDTIFLLSDGVFDDRVAGAIRAANSRRCSISTIAFHDASGEAVLKRIASENEGTYRFVPPP